MDRSQRQNIAVLFILLLAGQEVNAIRVNVHAGCDTDIIATVAGLKKRVEAGSYNTGEWLRIMDRNWKASARDCNAEYQLGCTDSGYAALRKVWQCGSGEPDIETRPFDLLHRWRSVTMKASDNFIKFPASIALPNMTLGLCETNGRSFQCPGTIYFTPASDSCRASLKDVEENAAEIHDMLDGACTDKGDCSNGRSISFLSLASKLKGYQSDRMQLEAMDCTDAAPEHGEVTSKLVKAMRAKFVSVLGNNSPLVGERFDAALEKLVSLGCDKAACVPSKQDIWEVYVLMQYGPNSPYYTEGQPDDLDGAMGDDFDIDFDEESILEDAMEQCLKSGSCDALESHVHEAHESGNSLVETDDLLQTKGWLSVITNVILLLCFLVLVVFFWPLAVFLLLVWLLTFIFMWPFFTPSTVVIVRPDVYKGPYGYLVDVYGRPLVDGSTGWPLMEDADGQNIAVKPAPPLVKYVTTSGGSPVYDSDSGWPLAVFESGATGPFKGVPEPYSKWAAQQEQTKK